MYKIKYLQIQNKKRVILAIIFYFVVFFGSANILFAEGEQLKNVSSNSDMQEKYVDVLEKTNQQLSLFLESL